MRFTAIKWDSLGQDWNLAQRYTLNMISSLLAVKYNNCLLYTSDAADEEDSVDLGGRRIIKNCPIFGYHRPILIVPLRYRIMRFTAIKWDSLG